MIWILLNVLRHYEIVLPKHGKNFRNLFAMVLLNHWNRQTVKNYQKTKTYLLSTEKVNNEFANILDSHCRENFSKNR